MSLDLRQHPRRLFKTNVALSLEHGIRYQAKSYDISTTGMSIVLQHKSFKPGQICTLCFEIPIHQKTHRIISAAKIIYSVCSQEGFKTGVQFINMDIACSSALEAFMA